MITRGAKMDIKSNGGRPQAVRPPRMLCARSRRTSLHLRCGGSFLAIGLLLPPVAQPAEVSYQAEDHRDPQHQQHVLPTRHVRHLSLRVGGLGKYSVSANNCPDNTIILETGQFYKIFRYIESRRIASKSSSFADLFRFSKPHERHR